MNDLIFGMLKRLVEVLRRLTRLMELAVPAFSAPAQLSVPAPLTNARQLSVDGGRVVGSRNTVTIATTSRTAAATAAQFG